METEDTEFTEHRKNYFTRNYWTGVINGTLFRGGGAFLDPTTVIPEFLSYLTNSSILIGGISTIFRSGILLTQIFTANYVETKPLKLPIYAAAAKVRIISVFIIALTVFIFGGGNANLVLIVFLMAYILYSFASGLGMIPYQEVVAKTIYSHKRGSYVALRQFFGSLTAVGVGYVVAYVLSKKKLFPYPNNYAILFFIGGIMVSSALLIFIFGMKEPSQSNIRKDVVNYKDYFSGAIKVLKKDKIYLYVFIIRLLIGAEALSMPFFIRFARTELGMNPKVTGAYLTVQMVGRMSAALLWGKLADEKGNKLIIQIMSLVGTSFVILALSAEYISGQLVLFVPSLTESNILPFIYGGVFFLIGSFFAGQFIGFNNYILEIAPIEKRPTYLGFFNSISGFQLLILPFLGGFLVDYFSYKFVFICVLISMITAFIMSFRLVEPRFEKAEDN